ncbi:MAG: NAD(P)-binding domain-containing protein, partial [Planctomycetota bacterium]
MVKKARRARKNVPLVGIVGLGYVGLPLAREFCRGGAKVIGFDINKSAVAKINKGQSPLKHIPNKDVKAMVQTKRFKATDSMS